MRIQNTTMKLAGQVRGCRIVNRQHTFQSVLWVVANKAGGSFSQPKIGRAEIEVQSVAQGQSRESPFFALLQQSDYHNMLTIRYGLSG